LILLDACRDNPFAAKLPSASLSPTRGGLAKLEEISADTLVAFAAKAGSTSYDGDGVNSPYATALLRHLAEPGVDIRIALGRVRDEVVAMTGGRQEPFIYGSLGGATISLVPQLGATNAAPVASPLAAAPIPLPVPMPTLPKPVAVNPKPPTTPSAVKAELPKPPLPAQPAPEITDPCVRDEARLTRLRAHPAPDEVINFQREVACKRLHPQVQRLFESVVSDTTPSLGRNPAPQPAPKQQTQNGSARAEDTCARDTARLVRMRAEPKLEAITQFEKELSCEQLRSQLLRLRQSVAP
jgi:hypothetical protein